MTGRTATGGPVWCRTSGRSITGWAPIVVFLAALAAGLLLAVSSASADTITSKQAQAQEVMSQVQQLYSDEERATEAWNYAGEQLHQIDGELATNGKNLVAAKKSLRHAQDAIATRLRQLYIKGESDSTLEVLLGSSSLEDVVTRLDALQRVSHQDSKILTAVKKYKREVLDRRAQLQDARAKQVDLVAERASQKQAIEGKISEQNRLLASIKDQIAQMKIEEQRREAELAAQARARLAAEEAAAQQAAAQQAAAAAPVATDIPDAPPPDGTRSTQVVSIAMQYLGVPYVWGGASPSTGFDCSGFVMYVFAQVGVYLPHHAASQYGYGTPVSQDQLAPGDLVFFDGLGHVGIYIGGGQFIHAPHTGDVVKISSLYEDWYSAAYVGARRVL